VNDDRDLGHVTIGAREIYDELVAMREESRNSGQLLQGVVTTLADHETRIRGMERWKYSLPAALVTAVISAGVTLVTKLGA
jgi:hypothetical protein